MRVFLDIGGHYGETVDVALDPRLGFDRVASFEPSTIAFNVLKRYRSRRLEVHNLALSNRDGDARLYASGSLGASLLADKSQLDDAPAETVHLERISHWVRHHTDPNDELFIKMNCEGAEADILEDLIDSDVRDRVRSILIDFDIRKSPSEAGRQEPLENRLQELGIHYMTPEALASRGPAAVRAWLAQFPSRPVGPEWRYRLGLHRPLYRVAQHLARLIMPDRLYRATARTLGRTGRRLDVNR